MLNENEINSDVNPPLKLFAKARINKKWRYITFDCVGLSIQDEPGFKGFRKMIEGLRTVVKALMGRRCRIVEINAIH